MKTRVKKSNGSLAILIPKAFAERLDLYEDAVVEMDIQGGTLVIHRAAESSGDLAELSGSDDSAAGGPPSIEVDDYDTD